jgi:hypothetical protein
MKLFVQGWSVPDIMVVLGSDQLLHADVSGGPPGNRQVKHNVVDSKLRLNIFMILKGYTMSFCSLPFAIESSLNRFKFHALLTLSSLV